jgi:hypothetical protein
VLSGVGENAFHARAKRNGPGFDSAFRQWTLIQGRPVTGEFLFIASTVRRRLLLFG